MNTQPEQIGTRTRDAKTDPRPHDYLPPGRDGISPGLPDEWPTYNAWRNHVISLGLPDPGPHRFGPHI